MAISGKSMQIYCYLTHKFKRTGPSDKEEENERNKLISINERDFKESIVDDWLIEHFKTA